VSDIYIDSITFTRTVRNGEREIESEVYLSFTEQQPELEEGDMRRLVGEVFEGIAFGPKDKSP
jgi:hypothetical protein